MITNNSAKEALIIVGGSLLIFFVFKPLRENQDDTILGFGKVGRAPMDIPEISDDQLQDSNVRAAYESLCAYINAYNSGASQETLNLMCDDFANQNGIILFEDNNGMLAASDLEGNPILQNNLD